MWTCPNCHRVFKTKNQAHSCVIIQVDDLFIGKPARIRQMYDLLAKRCSAFGEIKTDTTKSCLYFVDGSRYLAIKPQRTGIVLEFILDRTEDVFPVIFFMKIGKNQYVHRIKLDNPDDINHQVLGWIEEARNKRKK